MAGIFYSLQEVCERLEKSENEIKQLVQEGKLREFRDGSNLLFKVEDVNVLSGLGEEGSEIALSIDDSGELSLASGQIETAGLEDLAAEDTKASGSGTGADTKIGEDTELEELAAEATKASDSGSGADTKIGEDTDELSLEELTSGESGLGIGDKSGTEMEDLSGEDTKFATAGDSINVLGGTEDGYNLTDDTSGETKLVGDENGEEETSLERLDDDMNLDSFGGSGSGLLDLSLQADDTSLGAVLDDIYPEGGGADNGNDAGMPAAGEVGVVEEAEKIFEDAEAVPSVAEPRAQAVYIEPVSTGADLTFAIALFLALLTVIYAGTIVAAAVINETTPGIMLPVQGIIWYIMAAAAVLVLILVGIGAVMGAGPAKKSKKVAEVYQQGQEK